MSHSPIGTPRPNEPVDALEQAKHGAWVGDRERRAWAAQNADAWSDLSPAPVRRKPWGVWRRRREAA